MRTTVWIRAVLILNVSLAAAVILALPAHAKDAEKDVLAAVDTWRKATLTKDRALFEKIYHPDLSYGHSSGLVETKDQAIKHVADSQVTYEGFDVSDAHVQVLGNTALVRAKTVLRQKQADDSRNVVDLMQLTVWTRGPKGWQLIGRQASRINPPASSAAGAKAPASPGAQGAATAHPAAAKAP